MGPLAWLLHDASATVVKASSVFYYYKDLVCTHPHCRIVCLFFLFKTSSKEISTTIDLQVIILSVT